MITAAAPAGAGLDDACRAVQMCAPRARTEHEQAPASHTPGAGLLRPTRKAAETGPRPARSAVQNRLLAALPPAERDRLLPHMDIVPLRRTTVLHAPGAAIDYVYFPGGGFCSIVTVLQDGRMVEVATVGREGAVGLSRTDDRAPSSATIVQGATDVCYRMTTRAYRREMDQRGPFYDLVTRFVQVFMDTLMQSTACHAVHTVEQRLSCWLLRAHDRMERDEFPLTQETAAMMLGTTRPTVTVVAGMLQKAAAITYRRGRVVIVDRTKLESASCECYRVATALWRT